MPDSEEVYLFAVIYFYMLRKKSIKTFYKKYKHMFNICKTESVLKLISESRLGISYRSLFHIEK